MAGSRFKIFMGRSHGRPLQSMIGLLFVFLFLSSGAILYTTAQNMFIVDDLALQALQSTAFALASSVEHVIRLEGKPDAGTQKMHEIFSDRVIAYALIGQQNSTISFHTNPALIGSRLPKEDVDLLLKTGTPIGKRMVLQTGTPAYQFDSLLHNSDGTVEILRLVLHTSPTDQIVRKIGRSWWTVGAVLSLLWITGVLLWRMMIRHGRLQADFEKRQQLAVLGQMTAVLAHEIRNALASIKGYTQLINEKTPDSDFRKTDLAAVLQGTGRIEHLVHDLLLFSREEVYHATPVDAFQLLGEVAHLSLPSWKGTVKIEGEARTFVMADAEKLHRVIENGIRNAIQSMGDQGGTLTLSARMQGRLGVITIEDTGTGIGEKEFSRLFTPFFTTKTDGVGLGLSYSEKVVQGMGGQIYLSNRTTEKGAVLTIHLPRAKGANA